MPANNSYLNEALATPLNSDIIFRFLRGNGKFQNRLASFMDPAMTMSADEQLSFMDGYLKRLGFTLPGLDREELKNARQVARENPTHRIIPAPLLPSVRRWAELSGNVTAPSAPPFRDIICKTSRVPIAHQENIKAMNGKVEMFQGKVSLRYLDPKGKYQARMAFISSLLQEGLAVMTNKDFAWTFPAVDISPMATQDYTHLSTAEVLLKKTNPVLTREAMLVFDGLRRLLPTEPENPRVSTARIHVVNESVHLVKGSKGFSPLYAVGGVSFAHPAQPTHSAFWKASQEIGIMNVKSAASAI